MVILNLGFPLRLLGLGLLLGLCDRIIVAAHELLVDGPLFLDLGLIVIERSLISDTLQRVTVLHHSWVLVGPDIAAVVERLHMRVHRDLASVPSLALVF